MWVDEDGRRTRAATELHDYQQPRFSPAGDKLAVWLADISAASSVFILDLESERMEQVTFDSGQNRSPVWMPDGRSIIFASDRGSETPNLYRQVVDGTGEAELLLESDAFMGPMDVSPDGRVLVYEHGSDLYFLSLEDGTVTPFLTSEARERTASFSPDGKFLTYVSSETGQREVYVSPYPPTGGKRRVSRGGGIGPVWSPDGRQLYYMRDQTMIVVSLRLSPSLEIFGERELFQAPVQTNRGFDVHPKTGRLLIIDKTVDSPIQYVNIVTNFFELLQE